MIIDSGYSKPVSTITLAERPELVKTMKMHFTLLCCKAELDQLKRGLSILGMETAILSIQSCSLLFLFIAK